MNWFDTSGLTSLAKTALKEAQKTIDKALDIQDESGEETENESSAQNVGKSSPGNSSAAEKDNSDFFASWGLTVSAESSKDEPIKEQPVVTESPSKATSQSLWGSFAGSFFEQPKDNEPDTAIVKPPKAKSMNLISDVKYGSQDDLFSKSQLVMSDGAEGLEKKIQCSKDDVGKDDRRSSTRSNRLSLMSSRNSSDSVEVLSQSMKTTPDSEAASGQSMSHSSSVGQKLNSDSVEVLPDSLVSPSSIECLGFGSYSSDKNSSTSSNLSPGDVSDKKTTTIGEHTERPETADSVSLVADDDEDTMSYNSVSECTAPTVLDTDDKPVSPFQKPIRAEPKKGIDKDFIHLEQSLSQKMQFSENSSNDGSWSDRTLNADSDSITLETAEEQNKKSEEELLMERLSDSSSFYDVNVTAEMSRSDTSAFVNIERNQCDAPGSSDSSQKECSVKERTSPISSDSKSDLVKIGSDRTSGHTSGDELETTTSSDIEIIPSPNGDSHGYRSSPTKYAFKGKFDGTTSPNLVDLVLGKSLATKIRGHNRELSEASVQSNTSDESQCSETDRLMRRLCEMAEILESRESRLMEVSRSNAELAENNADLKTQVESLLAKHEGGDISMITEDYTQRMSALEKKFQQAIREKDQLRKQLDSLKSESSSRKNSSEMENALKEKDDVIAQLQEEGEKLAKQQLQHSNIIKKLRAKEKDNEQVIKSMRDKIAEQSAEMDRLKRSMAAKEELEVNQIEAVYRLTTANKKLETELLETKSQLEDTTSRLETTRSSLEVARRELTELQRGATEVFRLRAANARLEEEAGAERQAAETLRHELQQLRAEMVNEQSRAAGREEALRRAADEAREQLALATRDSPQLMRDEGVATLLCQLAALQRAALDRDANYHNYVGAVADKLNAADARIAKATENERVAREQNEQLRLHISSLQQRLRDGDALADRIRALAAAAGDGVFAGQVSSSRRWHISSLQQRLRDGDALADRIRALEQQLRETECSLASKTQELEEAKASWAAEEAALRQGAARLEAELREQGAALAAERNRAAILQEQLTRGEPSPPPSVASDSLSNSMWPLEDVPGPAPAPAVCALSVEDTLSTLTRRDGELRAQAGTIAALLGERERLRALLAALQARLDLYQGIQEQYDALLQMYGEKEEQLSELRLDLQDVTQLYKQQLDELIALRQHR
ncbi:LOW QUALITY PROTEIN: TATA element modulatory factor [Amyelois transitella]|uniref:LOW QUALITY PROTEIN: TATA element modulatory factor n=1 Tax=Amyelois transitella TaxID=680683 RepID=UPI00298FC06A|nr:LOW QUALITY PROTEIN: TATA element modulatory factor [Amyelois transitella]